MKHNTVALAILFVSIVSLCAAAPARAAGGKIKLADMEVVDCIVEGAVRQIGRNFTYQEPPRMARLTRFECASMGGTFKVYDPTAPNAMMEQWLPYAEGGDADAQHRLGLLYEGVMGAEPDYAKAAHWYRQAAAQGHREAIYAMSVLFEKGLGVEKDLIEAVNWYRKASGLEGDSFMWSSQAYAEIEALRASMTEELEAVRAQRDVLEQQVTNLQASQQTTPGAQAQIDVLRTLIDELNGRLEDKANSLEQLPEARPLQTDAPAEPRAFAFQELPERLMRKRQVGRFYAVVIGNTRYRWLPALATSTNDAERIAELLEKHYGFSTELLIDADEEAIKRAIYTVETTATERDNILIYFSGHGRLTQADRARMKGYWMPTNADPQQDANWIDHWWITDHLDATSARRALIVADSCYGGVFTTDLPVGPVLQMPELSDAELRVKLERKSRFVLSSGDVKPFAPAGSDAVPHAHSAFAQAFMNVLTANEGSLSVVELYGRIFDGMDRMAGGPETEPELRVLRAAGHESEGDYFFVRSR